jgi:uncharacterized protein YjdB
MKKNCAILLAALFAFSGCPVFETALPPESIAVFVDGAQQSAVTIEEGQSITLRAKVSPSMENVSIVWEINNENAAIVSSGGGEECTIRGIKNGSAGITVKAWLGSHDSPVSRRISIAINSATVTDIVFHWPHSVFAGEERTLSAALVPAWADGLDITWSNPVNLSLAGGKITGISAGQAAITAAAGGKTKTFNITVKAVPALSGLAIFNGTAEISGGSVEIGLYEEIALNAAVTPENETFFTWVSADPDTVSIENGVVKGLRPGQAVISAGAGGFAGTKQVTIRVKDPVTGIIVKYDNNSESLPVSNVIWLAPNDQVKLKVETSGGVPDEINWPVDNGELTLTPSNGGANCAIAYKNTGTRLRFDEPPIELRVTAGNSGNDAELSAVILVKKLDSQPLWAWDRARDADGNTALSSGLPAANNLYGLKGRGKDNVQSAVWGNNIPYLPEGLKLNSSNNYSGKNPDPIGAPGNSTRIAVGITARTATAEGTAVDGIFDFLDAFCEKDGAGYKKDQTGNYILKPEAQGKMIRVSVDYEIIWTAGAGRDMWIMLNNNNANAAQAPMRTDSQILIEPLTAARGTRATAVTYIDVWDMVDRKFDGYKTLEKSFICVIALSNGGNIYVSGVRIEYEEG